MSPNLKLIGFELTELEGYKVVGHVVSIGAIVAIIYAAWYRQNLDFEFEFIVDYAGSSPFVIGFLQDFIHPKR